MKQPVGALLEQHVVVTFVGAVGVVVVAYASKSRHCKRQFQKEIANDRTA